MSSRTVRSLAASSIARFLWSCRGGYAFTSARMTILAATFPDCMQGGTPSPKTPAPAKNKLGKKVDVGKRENMDWSGVIAGP